MLVLPDFYIKFSRSGVGHDAADNGLVDRAVDNGDNHHVDNDDRRLGQEPLEEVGPQEDMKGGCISLHDDAVEGASNEAEDKGAQNAHRENGDGHLPGVPGLRQAAAENILGAQSAEDARGVNTK